MASKEEKTLLSYLEDLKGIETPTAEAARTKLTQELESIRAAATTGDEDKTVKKAAKDTNFDKLFPTLVKLINTLALNSTTKEEREQDRQEKRRESETDREYMETVGDRLLLANERLQNIDDKLEKLLGLQEKSNEISEDILDEGGSGGGGGGGGSWWDTLKTALGIGGGAAVAAAEAKIGAKAAEAGALKGGAVIAEKTAVQTATKVAAHAIPIIGDIVTGYLYSDGSLVKGTMAALGSFGGRVIGGVGGTLVGGPVGGAVGEFGGSIAGAESFSRLYDWGSKLFDTSGDSTAPATTPEYDAMGNVTGSSEISGAPTSMPSFDSRAKPETPVTPRMGGRFGQYPIGATEKPNLTTISTKSGKSTQVAKEYASNFQGFINELEATGYEIKDLGGYADRANVNDPSKKSYHAFGAAIDINPQANPNRRDKKLITDMPQNISAIAAKYGLGWGGNWNSVKDPMHFSIAKGEGGTVNITRSGVVPGEVAGGAVTSSSSSAAEAHGKDSPAGSMKLSAAESKTMQNAALSRSGGGMNTAAMQPPAPTQGAALSMASSADISAQRDSASSKIQEAAGSSGPSARAGFPTGVSGTQDTKSVGIVEPIDARTRFAELFDMRSA